LKPLLRIGEIKNATAASRVRIDFNRSMVGPLDRLDVHRVYPILVVSHGYHERFP